MTIQPNVEDLYSINTISTNYDPIPWTISHISFIAGALLTRCFIAGTTLTLTATIVTGVFIIGPCGSGAWAIAKIAIHILSGQAQAKDWVFLALAVVGAVIGFFVGGGIPAVLGAFALVGGVLGCISLIDVIDFYMYAPGKNMVTQVERQIYKNPRITGSSFSYQIQSAVIRNLPRENSPLPDWWRGLPDYF